MDPISHITNKLAAERARGAQQENMPETAPPPYAATVADDTDDDDDVDDDQDQESPLKIIINAGHSVHGSNNLVPTSPSPLADATKFSNLLLHAINQINNAHDNAASAEASTSLRRQRRVAVDLTINCGVTVIGDRNVVGGVGLKPRSPAPTTADLPERSNVVAGAKRRAEEDPSDESDAKRCAVGGE